MYGCGEPKIGEGERCDTRLGLRFVGERLTLGERLAVEMENDTWCIADRSLNSGAGGEDRGLEPSKSDTLCIGILPLPFCVVAIGSITNVS